MKTRISISLAVALILTSSALSYSQSSAPRIVKADRPFDFVVGKTTFEPGRYEVSVNWQGRMSLQGAQAGAMSVSLQTVQSAKPMDHTKLVFHRLGEHYFLAQIWMEGETTGREVPLMRLEREILSKAKPAALEVLAHK